MKSDEDQGKELVEVIPEGKTHRPLLGIKEVKALKKGLRPTRRQKIAMKAAGINFNNWLVFKNVNGNLHLVHRETGTTRMIPYNEGG